MRFIVIRRWARRFRLPVVREIHLTMVRFFYRSTLFTNQELRSHKASLNACGPTNNKHTQLNKPERVCWFALLFLVTCANTVNMRVEFLRCTHTHGGAFRIIQGRIDIAQWSTDDSVVHFRDSRAVIFGPDTCSRNTRAAHTHKKYRRTAVRRASLMRKRSRIAGPARPVTCTERCIIAVCARNSCICNPSATHTRSTRSQQSAVGRGVHIKYIYPARVCRVCLNASRMLGV